MINTLPSQMGYQIHVGVPYPGILSVPQNIVLNLNNVTDTFEMS